jgi:hypothetical protein
MDSVAWYLAHARIKRESKCTVGGESSMTSAGVGVEVDPRPPRTQCNTNHNQYMVVEGVEDGVAIEIPNFGERFYVIL